MSEESHLIYIVDDEPDIRKLLAGTLEDYQYRTKSFSTGADLIAGLQTEQPDLCLVDLGLPDMDGTSLIRRIRDDFDLPILVISGRKSVGDRVLGLEMGADDYLVKPFEPREVIARVRSILRRSGGARAMGADEVAMTARFEGMVFDPTCLKITCDDGREIILSAAEAELLTIMLKMPNRVMTREALLELRPSADPSFDRSIDVRISRLRKKLSSGAGGEQIIRTVYGAGYMFVAQVSWVSKS